MSTPIHAAQKKSKFITQNKWAMHLFNLSILIMQSCMRLNNGFTHWNVRRLEFLHEWKSFIKSRSFTWSYSLQEILTFKVFFWTNHKNNLNWPVLRLNQKIVEGRNLYCTAFPSDCRTIVRKYVIIICNFKCPSLKALILT